MKGRKKKGSLKSVLGIAAVVLAFSVTGKACGSKGSEASVQKVEIDSPYELYSDDMITGLTQEYGKKYYTFFVNKTGKILYECCDTMIVKQDYNATGDTIAFYNENEDTLYVLTNDKLTAICNGTDEFVLSAKGTKIAYLSDYADGYGTLYIRDINENEAVEIAKYVSKDNLVLSPDGSTIAYDRLFEEGEAMCIAKDGKEVSEDGLGLKPMAVSDGGTYIYYYKDNQLCVKADQKELVLSDQCTLGLQLNEDCSEVLFQDGNNTCLCKNGEEKIVLFEGSNYQACSPTLATSYTINGGDMLSFRRGFPSFLNLVYYGENGYCYLDSDRNVMDIRPKGYGDLRISATGDTVMYSENEQMYIRKLTDESPAKPIGDGTYAIENFESDAMLNGLYFHDPDQMFYMDLDGKVTEISNQFEDKNTSEYDNAAMDYLDGTMYFITVNDKNDKTLSYSKAGSKCKNVKGADEIKMNVYATGIHVVYENLDDVNLKEIDMMTQRKPYTIKKAKDLKKE